jgi:hypothetical protein
MVLIESPKTLETELHKMSEVQDGAQEEAQTEDQKAEEATAKAGPKSKVKATGNLIADVAAEVEGLSKTKALNMAAALSDNIEANYFKLGGVLSVISTNGWFEGYADFDDFVEERYGFKGRKARYLMQIYTDLVTNQIPWEKVAGLGWTKLKDLTPILTLENLDDWVETATKLTVRELQTLLAGPVKEKSDGKTTDDIQTIKFKLKNDQVETVNHALAKAKGEVGTEFDNVAIENICALYLSGNAGSLAPTGDIKALIQAAGWQQTLMIFGELFPDIDLEVSLSGTPAAPDAAV